MRAFRPIVLTLTTAVMLFTSVTPASAVSTEWDPDDQSGVIDLRWVGIVRIDADTVRITITTWDPVKGLGPEAVPGLPAARDLHHVEGVSAGELLR
ncbi:MAG: hypothetical protein ACXWZU_13745 [Actinomycetota bacterium]